MVSRWFLKLLILIVSILVGAIQTGDAAGVGIPPLAKLERKIPCFQQRFGSPRWQVRYSLVLDLTGRDLETKRALELLIRDENDAVAGQAVGMYLNLFVDVRRDLIRPDLLATQSLVSLPRTMDQADRKALVDACLGRGPYPFDFPADVGGSPAPLDLSQLNNPDIVRTITLVGILGELSDAPSLEPFLESENDYVVLNTAKAMVRLGDREAALAALRSLVGKDPRKHLFYITAALAALRETGEEDWRERAEEVLKNVDEAENIQANWVNGLVMLLLEDECGEGRE